MPYIDVELSEEYFMTDVKNDDFVYLDIPADEPNRIQKSKIIYPTKETPLGARSSSLCLCHPNSFNMMTIVLSHEDVIYFDGEKFIKTQDNVFERHTYRDYELSDIDTFQEFEAPSFDADSDIVYLNIIKLYPLIKTRMLIAPYKFDYIRTFLEFHSVKNRHQRPSSIYERKFKEIRFMSKCLTKYDSTEQLNLENVYKKYNMIIQRLPEKNMWMIKDMGAARLPMITLLQAIGKISLVPSDEGWITPCINKVTIEKNILIVDMKGH